MKCRGSQRCPRSARLSPCGESGLKCSRWWTAADAAASLPMRGEWIEMLHTSITRAMVSSSLSPCGESGLKYCPITEQLWASSLSPCGESGLKFFGPLHACGALCLSPCGESGLKCPPDPPHGRQVGRLSPCGESGLKSSALIDTIRRSVSLPMRGEWIEITAAAYRRMTRLSLSPCGESGLK